MTEINDRSKWSLRPTERERCIISLTENMAALRAKVGITQEELAGLIGVSRQTYAPIETGKRKMSWTIYLTLIFFYDYNPATHQMIRDLKIFPAEFVEGFQSEAVSHAKKDS